MSDRSREEQRELDTAQAQLDKAKASTDKRSEKVDDLTTRLRELRRKNHFRLMLEEIFYE
jgi:hypothetical protein